MKLRWYKKTGGNHLSKQELQGGAANMCLHPTACCQPQLQEIRQRVILDDLEGCFMLSDFIIMQTTGPISRHRDLTWTHLPLLGCPNQTHVPHTVTLSSQPHLIDIDLVLLHVVSVIDLPTIHKLHQKDPLGGQLPVDLGDLEIGKQNRKV